MLRITYFLLLLLLIHVYDVRAKCKECIFGAYHKCIAPNQYQFCTGTVPVGDTMTCPDGKYCTSVLPCATIIGNNLPECTCGYCNKDANDNFACISKTQKAKCTGSNTATTQYTDCGSGKYCGISSGVISCLKDAANNTYGCEDEPLSCMSVGKFAVENSGCKKYYICEMVNGKLVKNDFDCLGTTFFNPKSLQCTLNYIC